MNRFPIFTKKEIIIAKPNIVRFKKKLLFVFFNVGSVFRFSTEPAASLGWVE